MKAGYRHYLYSIILFGVNWSLYLAWYLTRSWSWNVWYDGRLEVLMFVGLGSLLAAAVFLFFAWVDATDERRRDPMEGTDSGAFLFACFVTGGSYVATLGTQYLLSFRGFS